MAGPWEQFQPQAGDDAKPWEQFQPAKPSKPFGRQLNDAVADAPRQLGLAARYGLEGLGGMADMVTSPIRGALNMLPGVDIKPGMGQVAANALSLPEPRTADERVVGDASRMLAGGLLPIGAGAALARGGAGVAQGVGRMLAANPVQQLVSAGATGAAGGYTRETGGDDTSQMLASLAAGVGAPFGMNAASRGAQSLAGAARNIAAPRAPTSVQVDITINNAMQHSGMALSDLPAEVAAGMRADVAKAMQIGGDVSPDAVRRLADYKLTGATPNRAGLTLDPAIVTQQRNLAKLGINSKDVAAQQLGQMQNANNRQMTTGLNALGANTADDAIAGGGKVMGGVQGYDDRATGIIGQLYTRAKTSDGRSAALDPQAFATKADELLTFNLRNAELPADIRNKLNSFASGQTPLTIENAEQFKTIMGKVQRTSSDGGVRDAISHVRTALDETPLLPGQPLGPGSQAAFDRARGMNRQYMAVVEKTPALQAVRDGIEPDKFVQQFIVGAGPKANAMDVAMLKNSIKGSPDAMDAVRGQITSYLKGRALNGAADEVGNFSQSAYNKALNAVGDRKLRLFFEPDQINQMKAIGRVASYEQFQPIGSAINNSNTAAAGMSAMLDRLGSSAVLSKIPGGKLFAEPMQNIAIGMQAKKSLNVPQALTNGVRQPLPMPGRYAVSPAALMDSESDEDRRRREGGLLFP